jgi:hypothetical protein
MSQYIMLNDDASPEGVLNTSKSVLNLAYWMLVGLGAFSVYKIVTTKQFYVWKK